MVTRGSSVLNIISLVSEISACWTSRTWCWPCQTSGHFFAFSLVFGLILRFFTHQILIFIHVHDARKAGFAPYVCLAYRCPGQRRTTVRIEVSLSPRTIIAPGTPSPGLRLDVDRSDCLSVITSCKQPSWRRAFSASIRVMYLLCRIFSCQAAMRGKRTCPFNV